MKLQTRGVGHSVSDPKVPAVQNADYVPRPRPLDSLTLLGKELLWSSEPKRPASPCIRNGRTSLELARAHPDEGDSIPVLGIHVRLNLEDEPTKVLGFR